MIAQGKYDLTFRGARDVDIPLLQEQAASGGYEVRLDWLLGAGARPGWLINQDYICPGGDADLDAEIRATLRDKRVRQVLSYALDRQRVVDIDEGPFMLGAAGDAPQPVTVKTNIRNVPETGVLGPWAPGSPGNKFPEQFYIEQ